MLSFFFFSFFFSSSFFPFFSSGSRSVALPAPPPVKGMGQRKHIYKRCALARAKFGRRSHFPMMLVALCPNMFNITSAFPQISRTVFRIQHLDSRFATDQLTSAHGHVKISLRFLAKLVGMRNSLEGNRPESLHVPNALQPCLQIFNTQTSLLRSMLKDSLGDCVFANTRMHLSQRIEGMVLLLAKLVAPTACFPINGEMICA